MELTLQWKEAKLVSYRERVQTATGGDGGVAILSGVTARAVLTKEAFGVMTSPGRGRRVRPMRGWLCQKNTVEARSPGRESELSETKEVTGRAHSHCTRAGCYSE